MGASIYQIVNEKIVEQLRKGVIPWRKPWKQAGVPSNFISKKAYRGINVFLLACQGYTSPFWLSFKQCNGLGGKVRKGEHSTLVIYWKILESWKEDSNGTKQLKKIPLLRYYQVFNVEQCEGLKLPAVDGDKLDFKPLELAEAVVDGYLDKPELQEKENQAYYAPAMDIVNMPRKENFKSVAGYYASIFHELVHSTGHGDRLNREGITGHAGFGSEKYSKEELVAEFGASFLCGLCGIESELENSASYISGWLEKISENEKWLVTSATLAQKAVEYMQGVYYGQPAEAEAETAVAVAGGVA
jgi:antirestriction protein ArdC